MSKPSIIFMLGLFLVAQLRQEDHVIHRTNTGIIQWDAQPTSYEHSNRTVLLGHSNTTYKIWEANNIYFVRGKYFHMMSRLFPIELASQNNYHFYGVYFINCKLNPNFDTWIMGQAGKWPSHLDLYIEATSKNCDQEKKLHAAVELLKSSRKHSVTQLNCHTDQDIETHEYHGIHKAWQLGQLHSRKEDVIFYFHAKGITHRENFTSFEKVDKNNARATMRVIQSTDLVREVFDLFPTVAKVGISYSLRHGWIWYNYWYARGSYIHKMEEPRLEPTNRYYYENWLGTSYQGKRSEPSMCYSIEHKPNIGEYFDPNVWRFLSDPLSM